MLMFARRVTLGPWLLVLLVLVGYHYSLLSLGRGLTLQTPLAYLALVPVVAFAVGWAKFAAAGPVRPIHDRQVDYIIGIGCIVAAGAVAAFLPASFETRFWLYRLDLLTLPVFVAGIIALLYGVRRLWMLRFPVAFLLLAWPAPYVPLIGDGMRISVELTLTALVAITSVIPVAQPIDGGVEGLFWVPFDGGRFAVGVSSACSGVNSFVGFVIIGTALTALVSGSIIGRLSWLLVGLLFVWTLNVLRILIIFFVGATWGRDAALDVLHPIAGLVLFNIAIIGMLLLVPRFGLRFLERAPRTPGLDRKLRISRRTAGICLLAAVGFGLLNAGYTRYEALAGSTGQALLPPFPTDTAELEGWTVHPVATFDHGRPYFGRESTWERVRYAPDATSALGVDSNVYLDVIHTQDPNALAAYGLEACYTFHNYSIESQGQASVAPGVTANLLSYVNPRYGQPWTVLAWELPYAATDGTTSYERVVLLLPNGPSAEFRGPIADDFTSSNAMYRRAEGFLVSLARQMIANRIATAVAMDAP